MRELKAEEVRWRCPPDLFAFRTTAELKPISGVVGQKRAMQALRTGIQIRKAGYNIFVAGPPHSGRMTLIRECFKRYLPRLEQAPDRVYVNNFHAPYRPRLLEFPPGKGEAFVAALDDLINQVRDQVAALAREEGPRSSLAKLRNRFEKKRQKVRDAFEKRIRKDGFMIGQVKGQEGYRPDLLYLHEKRPLTMSELEELTVQGKFPADRFAALGRIYETRMQEFGKAMAELARLDQAFAREFASLEESHVGKFLRRMPKRLARSFPYPGVEEHLKALRDAILSRLHIFRPRPHDGTPEGEERDRFREFRGNLLFSRPDRKEPPVVFEKHPTFTSLFGFVERSGGEDGSGLSDFMDIRPGSMLEADRGFLVLDAADVLQSAHLWNVLKNILKRGSLPIHEPEAPSSSGPLLKPDPIPIDVKVILVGEPYLFDLLYDVDPDFRSTFKIRVDLEPDFPRTAAFLKKRFPSFVAKICAEEKLRPFDREAVGLLAEHGVRLAGRRNKFTASLGRLVDLMREADWCCRTEGKRVVKARHVECALRQSRERVNGLERRMTEAILNRSILIETKGRRVGQINGLAVYDLGDYSFCRPSRITVETSVGHGGIINIERESGMSGGTHDKGVHILTGYLRSRFAQKRPLSLTASICFEQSYTAIDGDSASSTEVYAILSSLSGLPIRQDIGVTGSVNQKGEIQAIGNVNEKIEGFFDVVRANRPTGKEGVIIPEANVPELMLRKDVVEAIRARRFHIWSVRTVEEGIEILTGVPAGKRRSDGTYTPGSVFDRVDRRLEELVRGLRKYHPGPAE